MLQNEYLVAKIGVDTAENEPSKVCWPAFARSKRSSKRQRVRPRLRKVLTQRVRARLGQGRRLAGGVEPRCLRRAVEPGLSRVADFRATTHHSFRGSFSAASTPIFATKYSFCSIFRDLQNELAEFSKSCKNFQKKIENSGNFAKI